MQNPANSNKPLRQSALATSIEQQMFKMLARNLDYAPSAADLPAAIQVMIEDLLRRGLTDADASRVVEAFSKLGPHLQKWPTSRTVIEALPHPRQMRSTRMLIAPTPMDDYVDKYIASHPMSSKKDACLAYLRDKKLLKNLPESLSEEETESRLEREAIQQE